MEKNEISEGSLFPSTFKVGKYKDPSLFYRFGRDAAILCQKQKNGPETGKKIRVEY